jgi:hypothetical protein
MRLNDATREQILRVIENALRDDDEIVSRALVAHFGYPHLLSLRGASDRSPDYTPYHPHNWSKYLMLANMIGAVVFSMMTVTLLIICYVRFLIRKRSFKEHWATWQATQLLNKAQRHDMFRMAVKYQHHDTRKQEHEREEIWKQEQQRNDIEGQPGERQKQE